MKPRLVNLRCPAAAALCLLLAAGCGDERKCPTDCPAGALPDLIVLAVDLQPRDPQVDEIVKIYPTVMNIGEARVDIHHEEGTPFWVSRHIGGIPNPKSGEKAISFRDEPEHRYLEPGETLTLRNLDFRYPGPGHWMTLAVDEDSLGGSQIGESNEANNRLLVQIDAALGE